MLRAVLGHTQADWARVLRINPQILNKWEQGVRHPNIETLVAICDLTGCTLDFIFRGRLGADISRELREALLYSCRDSPYIFELFSPVDPPPPPSCYGPRRKLNAGDAHWRLTQERMWCI